MKKTFALLLAVCTALTLVACGQPAASTSAASETSSSETSGERKYMDEAGPYFMNEEYDKAFEVCSKYAEAGDANALSDLAYLYANGLGTNQDYAKAVELYQKAVDAGSEPALYNLAMLYEQGLGVEKDEAKAIELIQKAADAGVADAMTALGDAYEKGRGVEQDYEKAWEWYNKGSDAGSPIAWLSIGALYLDGKGVEPDCVEALKWMTKALETGRFDFYEIDESDSESVESFTTRVVQSVLQQLGYECEVTGEADDATKAAVRQFRSDNGLAESDEINTELMQKLLEVAEKS